MDIIEIIAKALDTISKRSITVVQGWYDENISDTHITFCELSDRSNNLSDDEEEDIAHTIQIDIWSLKDEWELKKEIKKLMLRNDFGYIDGEDFFETDTKIYHKALRFNYLEEVN
ncbi:hypothetical protein ACQPVP_03355 [Clostridium nigeriense]|uniref:hypothetical protein n=1 Tax=Clostridium nigeriense TaxID=1805470 RepID=UPI003D345D9C